MNRMRCLLVVFLFVRVCLVRADDVGAPLFLSPYIQRGDIAEARRFARVPFTDALNITSYSGFLTVNQTYNSNHFFWYFPPINPNPTAPVLLWLQGGPGASSLYGLFAENGPFLVNNGNLELRSYNWALNHHLIYIDNPVGTGFSFTKSPKGYCVNEVEIGEQLYSSLTQFFTLFAELQANKFFVTGESYAGKYIPAIAYTIHKKNPTAALKINLVGMAIGDGWSDPVHQLDLSDYLYQIGLIDWNEAKVFEGVQKQAIKYIQQEKWNDAFDVMDTLFNGDLLAGKTHFQNISGFDFYYNFLHTKDYTFENLSSVLEKPYVRKGLHVGNSELHSDNMSIVERYLKEDVMQSVAPWVSELLEHYDSLIYSGQLDIIVAYPLTVNYLKHLNFSGAEEYKTAKRHIWRVDGEVAGYIKQAGHLTEVLVRNAGHMVPTDQPKWMLDLITRFVYGDPLYNTSDT